MSEGLQPRKLKRARELVEQMTIEERASGLDTMHLP